MSMKHTMALAVGILLAAGALGALAQDQATPETKTPPACCMPACAHHHSMAQHMAPEGTAEAAETAETADHAGHDAAARAGKMRCSLTGQTVESCCCVHQEGRLHCTLANKDVETCCCQPVADKEQARSDEATRE